VGIFLCEVATLLVGAHVLPDKLGQFRLSSAIPLSALPFGFAIERRLHLIRGWPTSTEKEESAVFGRSTTFGMMYFVPVFAAAVGRLVPSMLAVSTAIFLGLMVRIAWLYMTRPAAG